MDTLSHIVIGTGLGALAYLDPAVSSSETMAQAVLIGTVLGSNAPDFDIVSRLMGKGSYYRHHRGASHSLPALPIWGLAVSSAILLFFPGINFLSLFFWVFLAVVLHVVFDLFNMHGTQVLLPFSKKWITFDAIPLIDPFILTAHFIGFAFMNWLNPSQVFMLVYFIILIYLAIRVLSSFLTRRQLEKHFTNAERIKLIPHARWFRWDVIIETDEGFIFGTQSLDSLEVDHSLPKKINYPELVLTSRTHQNVSDFLSSTHFCLPFCGKKECWIFCFLERLAFPLEKVLSQCSHSFFYSGPKTTWQLYRYNELLEAL